jgi:hypothetical protein
MPRGRKSKPGWYESKKAWYVTVHGKRYRLGTERPAGWPDEAWIALVVSTKELGLGSISVTLSPAYTATPEFVRSCMPARGRSNLSVKRLQRVADQLREHYGPDAGSLMDADVTDGTDWEGAPLLRGLACAIDAISRALYEQDREQTAELFGYVEPEKLPQVVPRDRGRRCGYAPGGVEAANNVKRPCPRVRPCYGNNGTAKPKPPKEPKPRKPQLLDPAPESRHAYVNRQMKRDVLRRLDRLFERIAVTAEEKTLEREHLIRRGKIQVTPHGDVRRVAYPPRILFPKLPTPIG